MVIVTNTRLILSASHWCDCLIVVLTECPFIDIFYINLAVSLTSQCIVHIDLEYQPLVMRAHFV